MCAINPKHTSEFKIVIYTSHDFGRAEFEVMVAEKMLDMEMKLNEDSRIRAHVTFVKYHKTKDRKY